MAAKDPKRALRSFDVSYFDVRHADATYRVQIKRFATSRRFTLRVRAATRDAVLTMPLRGSVTRAKVFVDQHAAWIGARLDRLLSPTTFSPGVVIPLRGILHEICHRPGSRGTVWIETANSDDGQLQKLYVSGERPFVSRRIQDFLKRQARADLAAAVARHSAASGKVARRITLRDTSTRWGSCSSSGVLNFSWRLVMAPPHVLDYLAAHEVAHLMHMNHSDAFWAVTERLIPEYRAAETWLKTRGVELMRFGAAPPVSDAWR